MRVLPHLFHTVWDACYTCCLSTQLSPSPAQTLTTPAARPPLTKQPRRLCTAVLEQLARDSTGSALTLADRFSLAFTHGLGHGTVHSLFFFVWCAPPSYFSPGVPIYNDSALSWLNLESVCLTAPHTSV